MIPYIGDFAEDEVLYHYFNTFDSNDPSASVTITNLASTDLFVHKDGVDSTETTTGATVDVDFDTQTGIHKVTVDTSADAFYVTGADYMVRMEGTTVDGATINAALFTFSIQNRYSAGALRPTTAGRTLDVAATGEAGVDFSNVNGTLDAAEIGADAITAAKIADNAFSNEHFAAGALTSAEVTSVAGAAVTSIGAGVITAASVATDAIDADALAADALAEINTQVDTALSDIGLHYLVNTALPTSWNIDITGGSALDLMTTLGSGTYDRSTDSLEAQAKYVQDNVGVFGANLNDLGGMSTGMKAEVQAEVDVSLMTIKLDHLIAVADADDVADNSIIAKLANSGATADWSSYVNTTDSLMAIRDRGDAAWTTGAGGTPPHLLQSTTIATLASQTSFTLTAGSADDDAYNGAIVVVTDQSTSTQKAVGTVSDYTGSTKTVTLSADPAIFTMATGDTIEIMSALGSAGSAPTAVQIRTEMDSNSTQLAAIVADTNELQTDWANGGRLDLILDSRMAEASINTTTGAVDVVTLVTTTTTNSDMRGTDSAATAAALATAQSDLDIITGADGVVLLSGTQASIDAIEVDTGTTLDGKINTIDTVVDAIKVVTDALPEGGALTTIDANIDAILADTGTDGVVVSTATQNAIADALLDRDMSTGTDSGSTTVRTPRQALRLNRNKVSIAGGTMTVTKEDDSTTSHTAAVTTTAGDPITAIDPAGP